jgi:ABC-type nitrate/sulfonate/bicarbonate transport system substrate-binding protein
MTTRRKFLKSALATGTAIAGFPAIISSARAADAITFMMPISFAIDFIHSMNAYSGGHFAKQGIDAKLLAATTGAQAMQILFSGKTDFAYGSALDEIRVVAAQKTGPIAIGTMNQASSFRVISLKEKPVLKAEDFKGKTVGLISNGSPTEIYLDMMLAKVGLKKTDAERQVAGSSPGAIEIVKQGRIDCFISTASTVIALERAGEKIAYWSPDRYVPMPGQVFMTMPETTIAKPDLVVRVLKALKASVDEIMTQPIEPIIQRAAKDFEFGGRSDMGALLEFNKLQVSQLWLAQGKENLLRNVPRLWESGVAELREAGIADIKDPSVLYTNAFIDKALTV